MKSKLIFMNHILHLEETSLAKKIQVAQDKFDDGGLTEEVREYIGSLSLPDCFQSRIPKAEWKRKMSKAISKANEDEIRKAAEGYKKMKNKISEGEKFECKEYIQALPISQARTLFKHKYSMTDKVKMNFKGDQQYERTLWKCNECSNQDKESHLLWCSGYGDLRQGLDLTEDKDLCTYLQKIDVLA